MIKFLVNNTPRIKILFITKWFMNRHDPQLGVFIRKHASAAALYCDVSLLCVLSDPAQEKLFETEESYEYQVKATIVYFRKFSSRIAIVATLVNFYRYVRATGLGLELIKKKSGRHDVTHAYIMLRPALVAWWLKARHGIPFVISEQWSGYATGKFADKNVLEKFLCRFVFRKAGAATAVSGFLKEKMEASGLKNKYTITPNVSESVPPAASPIQQSSKTIILTVADLVDEIKNVSGTIRAIARIATTNSEIEFHIIGQGKDEAMLKKLAHELNLLDRIVFFHGVKKNEEVFQFLYASSFLVMNSRTETFSLICVEALSCGIPVIATRCGGPEDFINAGNGILIESGHREQLEDAIVKMINSHGSYDKKSLADYASTTFSAAETGKKFLRIYQALAGN